jgi:hypothetical protein
MTVPALLDRIAALLAVAGILGVVIVGRIGLPGVLNPGTGINTFFVQYYLHEPVFLAIMAAFAIATAVLARTGSRDAGDSAALRAGVDSWSAQRLWLAALLVFAVTAGGTWAVMHTLPFSMDEYVAAFQARAFAAGRTSVTLPDEWQRFGESLRPVFVVYDAESHRWLSAYWPIYGAVRAAFLTVGADRFLNPLLAALSLPLVFACARRLWPNERWRAWAAVAFLALSSQLLFMAMTGYAMPAHLVVNLLWIYAFLRNDRAGWIAAPIIGVIALGLHNPVPHALFVAPFLVYVLTLRRWGWTVYFGAVYLAGIAVWGAWAQAVTAASAGGSLLGLFAMPGLLMLSVQHLSLTVILSWQTPLLVVLLLWMTVSWKQLSAVERCLLLGIATSLAFFLFYPSTQGHGWGYRYTYPALGNMALLGAAGLAKMVDALGARTTRRLFIASALVTVFVQLPVRAWQVERYVRPFAKAHDYIAHLDADVVIVDPTSSWYGIDLIRNDPLLLNRPKVISAFYLRPGDKRALAERFGPRVHLLQPSELSQFGIPVFPSRFRAPVWP